MGDTRFPWWAAIAAGAGLLLLLVGVFLDFGAETAMHNAQFDGDVDAAESADTLGNVAGLLQGLGQLALGGAFLAAAAFGENAGWTRAVYAVAGLAALVPLNLL